MGLVAALGLLASGGTRVAAQDVQIYVTDQSPASIQQVDGLTGAQSSFATTGLSSPYGITADRQGNVYTVDFSDGVINAYTPAGAQSTFSTAAPDQATGLAFDRLGDLLVADEFSGNIEKFSPTGTDLGVFGTGPSGLVSLAFDAGGNLYASNTNTNSIEKFGPGGGTMIDSYPTSSSPQQLVYFGGNLYVANSGSNNVESLDATGHATVIIGAAVNGPLTVDQQGILYIGVGGQIAKYQNIAGTWTLENTLPTSLGGAIAYVAVPFAVVPEPGESAALLGGLVAVAGLMRGRRKSR